MRKILPGIGYSNSKTIFLVICNNIHHSDAPLAPSLPPRGRGRERFRGYYLYVHIA